MSKFIAFVAPFCVLSAAYAAEIADAPIPEDNILGILVFLALMIGGGLWFAWKIMRNNKKNKDDQDK